MRKFSGGGRGRCSASGASRARADDVGRGRGKEGRSRPSQAPGKAMVYPVLRLQEYDMCNRDRGYSSTSNPVHNTPNSFYTALQPDKNRPPTLAQPYVVSKPGVSFFCFFLHSCFGLPTEKVFRDNRVLPQTDRKVRENPPHNEAASPSMMLFE